MESIHQRHRVGNLLIFYAYYADANHTEEPAMFLANRRRKGTSYCIPLSHAHEYGDERHLILQAANIAERLEMGNGKSTVTRIADAILNYLPDLVKMPPKQQKPVDPREEMARDGIDIKVPH